MRLSRAGLAMVAALCLAPIAAQAQTTPAATPPPMAAMPPPVGTMITLDQATALIIQMGFTPVGQPVLKGTMIGSLARLGNNAFIVTVDATTGKFLNAKPTDVVLPPMAAPAPQAMATPAPAPTMTAPVNPAPTVVATPNAAAPVPVSPVKRAADLARSKGFKVLSFKHAGDDTFLVGQKGNALFQLKVNDKGVLLSVTPIKKKRDDDD